MSGSATISACGRYRYCLFRSWTLETKPRTLWWVMLNPSTADAERDDPTIRRCIGFSKDWGYGALRVVNLFAFRSKSPEDLLTAGDAEGPMQREWLDLAAVNQTVIACGVPPLRLQARARRHLAALEASRVAQFTTFNGDFSCLGYTAGGLWPRHPLYVRASAICEPFVLRI